MDNRLMQNVVFLLLMAFLVGPSGLYANDCSPWEIERAYSMTSVVFVGQIENIGKSRVLSDEDTSEPIRFKVKKIYKGRLRQRITVWTLPDWEWHGYYEHAPVIHTTDSDGKPVDIVSLKMQPYPPETEFLIFADYYNLQIKGRPKRRVLTVSMCSRSALLSERTDDVQYIETQRAKRHRAQPRKP
jgi:hypothetical protein